MEESTIQAATRRQPSKQRASRPTGISVLPRDTHFLLQPKDIELRSIILENLESSDSGVEGRRIFNDIGNASLVVSIQDILGHAQRTAQILIHSPAELEGLTLFAKFFTERQINHLNQEMLVYKKLKDLQGTLLPYCYGTFISDIAINHAFETILIFEDISSLGLTIACYDGPRSPEIFYESGIALKAIHERGVSHGDVSHGNILVKPGGGVLILDFERSKIEPPFYCYHGDSTMLNVTFSKYGWNKARLRELKQLLWPNTQ